MESIQKVRTVDEVFHAVADLSIETRNRFFREHAIETTLVKEVERLIVFDASATLPLANNIGQVVDWTLERFEQSQVRCGAYQLRTVLGHGGMGIVYRAERVDGELTQRVAVKLLQPGADVPDMRRRFLKERQILSTLSHPNVAKLLDAGHRRDGQPYLVMEFIDGEPIDTYAAELSMRQSAALFLKVCDAVSYLHRNLVMHRDLKPSNILVTRDGEPKVLDFGIAKIFEMGSDSGRTSVRIATPDYASPEQLAGRPITTATDIYSLGAVLYKMLTGECPRASGGDPAKAIALALSASPVTPPSKLAPHLKRDLEVVLMKALRWEPEQRYASVDALADDIRAFLDHRPVQARSGDVWYRARKLLRYHWASASAAALVIGSLSAGLYLANRERNIAEERFGQLRQLSGKVIGLDRSIRTLPGSIQARQQLVVVSLQYLERISRDSQGDLELSREISDGYWRMARIQGVNAESNLGDPANAQASLNKSAALIESILAARPRDRNALFRSALIAHDQMIIASDERSPDVMIHATKAVDRLEEFLRHNDPRDPVRLDGFLQPGNSREAELRGVATIFTNVALALVNLHRFEEGAAYARRAADIAEPIPSAPETGAALSVLANALRYQGRLHEALHIVRKARMLSEKAVYSSDTARVFSQYGPLLREGRILGERDAVSLGRPEEAACVLQKALDLNEEFARKDRVDTASRGRVATTARELGDVLRDRDPQRALAVYELGIQRIGKAPISKAAHRERAELLAKSAYPLRRLHHSPEAGLRIDAALAILRQTNDYPSGHISLGGPVYSVVRAQADHEADTGHPQRALELYGGLLAKAEDADPKMNLQDAARISQILGAMARLDERLGRHALASQIAARRFDLWRDWNRRLPNNVYVRRQIEAIAPASSD